MEKKPKKILHYYWNKKGEMICNYLKKECPINDTAAGSTCPICIYNPNSKHSIIIKT